MDAREVGREVYGTSFAQIETYVSILAGRGLAWGLLGPREGERLWSRHVLNSASLAALLPREARLVDVGSGAGLPGIPLAVLRPDLLVTLLEPLQRRAEFLTLAVDELGLGDRVRVVRARAEEHRDTYDVVTCRAVANLAKLLGWTAHLFLPREPGAADGRLVALKGAGAAEEVAAAEALLRRQGLHAQVSEVRAHPTLDPTYAVTVERAREEGRGRA